MNPRNPRIASFVALVVTLTPCLLYFVGAIGHDAVKLVTLIGTIAWFIVTPMWMGRESSVTDRDVQI